LALSPQPTSTHTAESPLPIASTTLRRAGESTSDLAAPAERSPDHPTNRLSGGEGKHATIRGRGLSFWPTHTAATESDIAVLGSFAPTAGTSTSVTVTLHGRLASSARAASRSVTAFCSPVSSPRWNTSTLS